jgi:hypothetical protein
MKKFLILFLFLISCQSAGDYEYSSGTSLYIDGSAAECVYDARTQTAHENNCENLGKMRLDGTAGVTAELQPTSSESIENVYLVFKDNDSDLNIPKLELDAQTDASEGWFELRIYFLDKENIYVWDRSGIEFTPGSLYYYNGSEWSDLDLVNKIREILYEESREITIRDILISWDRINVSVTLGDDIQYLELVNYILEFDRNTLELLDINEITKPL